MDITRVLNWKLNIMGAPRMTHSDKWKKRPRVVRYREMKDALNAYQLRDKYTAKKVLHLIFVVEFPKSYSKIKKAELFGKLHDQKPDTDNLVKGFKDALFNDDKSFAIELCIKVWGYESGIIIIEYDERSADESKFSLRLDYGRNSSGPESCMPANPERIFESEYGASSTRIPAGEYKLNRTERIGGIRIHPGNTPLS